MLRIESVAAGEGNTAGYSRGFVGGNRWNSRVGVFGRVADFGAIQFHVGRRHFSRLGMGGRSRTCCELLGRRFGPASAHVFWIRFDVPTLDSRFAAAPAGPPPIGLGIRRALHVPQRRSADVHPCLSHLVRHGSVPDCPRPMASKTSSEAGNSARVCGGTSRAGANPLSTLTSSEV